MKPFVKILLIVCVIAAGGGYYWWKTQPGAGRRCRTAWRKACKVSATSHRSLKLHPMMRRECLSMTAAR